MGLFKNPASSAQNYLNQIPGTVTPYYQPFIDAGSQAMGQLQPQYSMLLQNGQPLQNSYQKMAQNPVSVLQHIGSQYQMTPGAQFQEQQGEQAIANAQASGGMSGTPQDQYMAGQYATDFTNENFNDYMKMALGIGRQGLEGENNLYHTGLHGDQQLNNLGFRASNQLAETLAQTLMAQAGLAYSGAANKNSHLGGLIGAAMKPFTSPGFGSNVYDSVGWRVMEPLGFGI